MLGGASAAERIRATHLETTREGEATVVAMQFSADPNIHWFGLASPYRLVIDLAASDFAFEPKALQGGGLVSNVRVGDVQDTNSRILLTMKSAYVVESAEPVRNEAGYRLEIRVKRATPQEFQAMQAGQGETTAAIASAPVKDAHAARFRIVIDPGHGGADGGAEGANGTVEKDVTLGFSQVLRAELAKNPLFEVEMTRTADRFVRLDERVALARERNANLLISIHADSIRARGLRGATVYTGSEQASDADSQALAERENLSDRAAGLEIADVEPEVGDILSDLARRETYVFSSEIAKLLVKRMVKSIGMIKNPHRHAHFRVLRAPDVPSVLIELGYLSNAQDENSLSDPLWRAKAAEVIAAAVSDFADRRVAGSADAGEGG